jgi:hypothetical protein
MGFLDIFSRKPKEAESVLLVDIGTNFVAGAYVHYVTGELPALIYTERVPIEPHEKEQEEQAMLRTLKQLGEMLIKQGAPVLARVTGSGSVHMILVSVDAPWQETSVHTEHFEEIEPFTFTQSLVTKRLEAGHTTPIEKALVDESIVGTILNGYETHSPYGKKVHRAAVIVLTSLIERRVAAGIVSTLGQLYHNKNIFPIAGSSLRYQAMRKIFPHEDNAIILDATNTEIASISLVRKGLLVSLIQAKVPEGENGWVTTVTNELTEIAKQYPLPRTIFLLAHEANAEAFRKMLDTVNFSSLWLSDNPPKIVPIVRSQIMSAVRQLTETPPDVVLLLIAVFYANARETGQKF